MQRDFVAVPIFWTVGQTIDFMRESDGLPQDFYDIFVVDPRHRPIGTVPLEPRSAHQAARADSRDHGIGI